MTPMPSSPLWSQVVPCSVCKTELSIVARRDDARRTSTALPVSCPVCFKRAALVVPLSLVVSSVQVVGHTRPVDEGRGRTHA
jgi:hypothetical protein